MTQPDDCQHPHVDGKEKGGVIVSEVCASCGDMDPFGRVTHAN